MGAEASAALQGGSAAYFAYIFTPVAPLVTAIVVGVTVTATSYQQIKKQERDRDAIQRQLDAARAGLRGQMFRQAITSRKAVYGQSLVSGPIVFMHSTNNNSRLHLVVPVAAHEIESFDSFFINGEHVPMEEITASSTGLRPDNWTPGMLRPVMGNKYYGHLNIVPMKGADDQEAAQALITGVTDEYWTTNHRLRGVAYFYAMLEYSKDVFPRGIPNISCVIRGKKVRDPRQPAGTAKKWTDNAALCLLDYIEDNDYGLGFRPDEIDDSEFISSANNADARITLNSTHGQRIGTAENVIDGERHADGYYYLNDLYVHTGDAVSYLGGSPAVAQWGFATANGAGGFRVASTLEQALAGIAPPIPEGTATMIVRSNERQYTINGVIDSATNPRQVLRSLLDAQESSFVYTGGAVRLIPPSVAVNTGGYATGGNLIEEFHLVGGQELLPKVSRRDQVNTIKGVFVSPATGWQPTDYPPFQLDDASIEKDGGPLYSDIPFEFTISQSMAQRLSRTILNEERHQRTIEFSMNYGGMHFQVGDYVYFRINDFNKIGSAGTPTELFSDVPFRIISLDVIPQEQEDGTVALIVSMVAKEAPTVPLSWNNVNEAPLTLTPPTILPDPSLGVTPPTNLVLTSGNETLNEGTDGTVRSALRLSWVEPTSGFARFYEVGYKKTADPETAWVSVVIPAGTKAHDFIGVSDRTSYDGRIRSISGFGIESDYVQVSNHIVIGKTAPPPTSAPLDVRTLPNGLREFTFSNEGWPRDVQVGGGVQIRYSSDLTATWENMTDVRDVFRSSPWTTSEIPEGRYRFGIKLVDSSGNESVNARFSEHTLGRQDIGETFLQRSERDLNWAGTLGTDTIKIATNRTHNQLMARAPTGTDYGDLPRTWGDERNTEWNDRVYSPLFIDYTSPVISLPNPLTFAALIDMDFTGFVHTRTISYSNSIAGGRLVTPVSFTFTEGEPTRIITARYVQITVQVRPLAAAGGQVRRRAVLRNLSLTLSGDTVEYKYNDINTASSTATGFARKSGGTLTFEHLGGAGSISDVIVTIQGTQTSGLLSPRVISKNALTGGKVGAEIGIFNSANALTNATIDVVLRGPRIGVNRNPVDDAG